MRRQSPSLTARESDAHGEAPLEDLLSPLLDSNGVHLSPGLPRTADDDLIAGPVRTVRRDEVCTRPRALVLYPRQNAERNSRQADEAHDGVAMHLDNLPAVGSVAQIGRVAHLSPRHPRRVSRTSRASDPVRRAHSIKRQNLNGSLGFASARSRRRRYKNRTPMGKAEGVTQPARKQKVVEVQSIART